MTGAPSITLRAARPEDEPALVALARHPDVEPSLAPGTAERLTGGGDDELLVVEAAGALAGAVRLAVLSPRSRIGGVRSLMVDPAARGCGVGAGALATLCEHAFGPRGLHRLEADVYAFNTPALRAFERAGFTREGLRRRAYERHGAWQDGVLLGRLADDPPARSG